MENGQLPDDKLFRAVHDRLSDYEAPYEGADWDAMSRSLDSLPKTARFQWRISLNSILVILGVAGLSLIGYAVASHTGTSSNSKQPAPQQVATQPMVQQPQATSVSLNTTNNSPSAFETQHGSDFSAVTNNAQSINDNPQNNEMGSTVTADVMDPNAKMKKKKRDSNGLFFGDQIDPKKGFIYNTQEDKNALTPPAPISNPNDFYDMDNGQVKKIIHKDSSSTAKKERTFASDSTATNSPFAPVDGGQN